MPVGSQFVHRFMINLIFVTTTDCQLQCRHCLRGDSAGQHLPFEVIEKAVDGAKKYGIEGLHLTGGEPFLYKFLPQVLALAKREQIPVTFSTNGLLLPSRRDLLRDYQKQIRILSISAEGSRREIYERVRGAGHFQELLSAFRFCRQEKLPFGVLACLNQWNPAENAELIR